MRRRLSQMIEQPANRGTLPAILASLVRILREDPDAAVAFFPSDHHYTEEDKFMCGVRLAFETADANPESVILLGVAAKQAETEYGWIEAAPAISTNSRSSLLRVKRFWEKPSPRLAQDLLERGCVWNTFVMVGRAQAFLDMIRAGAREVYEEFEPLTRPEAIFDAGSLADIYSRIPPSDFSKLVLSAVPERLGVWSLGDVGWSDLGDPGRVVAALSEMGTKDEWMNVWRDRFPAAAAGR
jgi:mannose-1-phosphate guanylyltransferase